VRLGVSVSKLSGALVMKNTDLAQGEADDSPRDKKNSVEKVIDDVMGATKACTRAFLTIGAFPWRAGLFMCGKQVSHSATFIFVASFLLSLALAAWVRIFQSFDLTELSNIAVEEFHAALEPDVEKAIFSLFPGILSAELFSKILVTITGTGARPPNRLRQLVLLVFSVHAIVLALFAAILFSLAPAFGALAIGEAFGHRETFSESLLSAAFEFVPFAMPVIFALHFAVVMWSGAGTLGVMTRKIRFRILAIAVVYPILFCLYVAAICLPELSIAWLSPERPKGVDAVISQQFSRDLPPRARIDVLLENHTRSGIALKRQQQILFLFRVGQPEKMPK
jgi:hypothetical protein